MADDSEIPDAYEANELLATLSKDSNLHSPTLHISGIAINRSPGAVPLSASSVTESLSSNRNRSASLIVPPPTPQTAPLKHLSSNNKGIASCNTSPRSPSSSHFSYLASPITTGSATLTTPSSSPYKSFSHQQQQLLFTFPDPPNSGTPTKVTTATSKNLSPSPGCEINKNCRSPSTTRLLSSVLLVQESCLSSDDFHEALFLDKKSPSRTLNKKKRKSRKKDAVANVGINSSQGISVITPVPGFEESNKIKETKACCEVKESNMAN